MHLAPGRDFRLDPATRRRELTDAGRDALAEQATALGGLWQDRRHRDEIVTLALAAHHCCSATSTTWCATARS